MKSLVREDWSNRNMSPPFGEVWIEIMHRWFVVASWVSPPFGEVWIEIEYKQTSEGVTASPPFGEVWIEILLLSCL